MPVISLATVLSDALSIVTEFGGYITAGIAIALFPVLAKMGKKLIKGK
jgi:hypothetical protein